MDNALGAVLGIVFLIVGIAMFPIGFALTAIPAALPICFVLGILFLSACLPVPIFLLERFEGVRDR